MTDDEVEYALARAFRAGWDRCQDQWNHIFRHGGQPTSDGDKWRMADHFAKRVMEEAKESRKPTEGQG